MASVVASRATPHELKSVETQTDLTWPITADKPVQVSLSQVSKVTASTSTSAREDVGSADEKSKKGGKSKSSHPKLSRPPPTQTTPVTDTNRYAVLGTSSMEEGESSSSVIK